MKTLNKNLTMAFAILLLLGFAGISFGQDFFVKDGVRTTQGPGWVPGEILIKFKPGVSGSVVAEINVRHGASVLSASRFTGLKRLKIPKGKTVAEMVEIYKRNPNVEYAEPNFIASASMLPSDEHYDLQWHMDNPDYGGINMETAWDISQGDGVVVAVIDTGVAYEDYQDIGVPIGRSGKYTSITYQQAPDLASTSFVAGYDFVNDDAHPNDDEGHGTHVSGTIAQSTNNGEGTAGIAFNASIMPVKVLDSRGSGTHYDIANGIYFAADNSADVINMSLGGAAGSDTLEAAVAYAHGKGVSIVCSSGNDGSATVVGYPAAYNAYCIAVGATRYDEEVTYYSNGGDSLDLTAPGGDTGVDQNVDGYVDGVLQQTFGDSPTDFGYWFYQGTSMAAPHVSGVAALLIAHDVATTPDAIREVLQSTAEDKGGEGWDPAYGYGIVDAAAALNYEPEPNEPPEAEINGPYYGTEDIAVSLDGSGSFDPDNDTLTYRWDFGDGASGAGPTPTHTYTAGGEYTVTLIVNDGRVDSSPVQTTAFIEEVNDPPVADAGPDWTVQEGDSVDFDASDSYDNDFNDGIAAYSWDFGDGSTGSGVVVTHAYQAAGSYTAILTVTDNGGLTDTDTAIVTVTEEVIASELYVGSIVMGLSTKQAGRNAFIKAYATITIENANGAPVDGVTVYGSWSSATTDADLGLTDIAGAITLESDEVKNAAAGTTFTFNVTDVEGLGWTYDPEANPTASNSIEVP